MTAPLKSLGRAARVMNHNLETAPRLYKEARPGSDYQFSLNLLKSSRNCIQRAHQERHHGGPGRDGRRDPAGDARHARTHIDMLTIGQYLAPATTTCPCAATYPDTFKMFEEEAHKMGFSHAAVGAMVRSSYHADQQAHAAGV